MIHTKCLYCKSTIWDPIQHAQWAMGNIIQHFRMHKTHVPEAKSVLWSRVPTAMGKVRYQSGDHTQHAKVLLQSPFWALVHGPKVNCEYISGWIAFSKFFFCNKAILSIRTTYAYVSVSSNRLPIKYLAITCVALFILVITCCIGIWKR